ncbi:minor capsid protein [Sphingobium yanoikuyae]|jgi:SPP1 gp7 family putative phage head morphogenesis protein|uniref:minor capsid protein n=1 Tax=Sphingobium yanoikuyae TaxID=13690 RepID=UPI0035C7949E
MADGVNAELASLYVLHAIYAQRYGKSVAAKIVRMINSADKSLVDEVTRRYAQIAADGFDRGPATTRRIEETIRDLRAINDNAYRPVANDLIDELSDFAEYEAEWAASTIKRVIPVELGVNIPAPGVLRQLVEESPVSGYLVRPWLDGIAESRITKIEAVIRDGVTSGRTTDQIVRSLRGTRAKGYADGVLGGSRKSVQSMVLTATATVQNNAREALYGGNPTLVPKVRFVATLDTRTTDRCRSLDGKVFDRSKPHPKPALHIRCRSLLVPVTPSWRELGFDVDDVPAPARASMNGQVGGLETYSTWLPKQSRATIEEVLGKRKADLFISKKLKFQDFHDDTGKEYTLDQLRRLHPAAFR